MTSLNTALISIQQTPRDWVNNKNRMIQAINMAKKNHAQLLWFPELCTTSYGCEDLFFYEETWKRAEKIVVDLLPYTKDIICGVGVPVFHEGKLRNGYAIMSNGSLIGIRLKRVMANSGVYYESRWFYPWAEHKTSPLKYANTTIPAGDLCVEWQGLRLGFEICEEAWVSERHPELSTCDVIINPSASHFAIHKNKRRRKIVESRSSDYQCEYFYSNLLGLESGRLVYDGSSLHASGGVIKHASKRFSLEELDIHYIALDIPAKKKSEPPKLMHSIPIQGVDLQTELMSPSTSSDQDENPFEEFLYAESLALFHYLKKSKLQGYTVSLSGGCDSTVTTYLIYFMIKRAFNHFGKEKMKEFFPFIQGVNESDFIKGLMTTIYLKTKNNSEQTLDSASSLSNEVGCHFLEFNIDANVDLYTKQIASVLSKPLSWDDHYIPLQNIQARSRSPLVWMIANLKNQLLVSCCNRTEAALGYTTMDGDTSGGISPISGVSKAFLLEWLEWACETELPVTGPMKSLHKTLKLTPSAELSPSEQSDEKELMPFAIAESIETLFFWERKNWQEIEETLSNQHKDHSIKEIKSYILKFRSLWKRNQWKRERYALGFHISEFSFDPKTWCRYPAISN